MRPARRQRNLLAASLACALLSVTGSAAAAEQTGVATHPVGESPAEILDYWTPERLRQAEPIDQPASEGGGTAGGGARAAAIPPDQETNPALDTAFPQRLHGKLLFTLAGAPASCSATIVAARSRDLIVTAGHCVAIPGEVAGGATVWAANVLFAPGYREGVAPFGWFPGTRLGAPAAWAQGGDVGFDLGAINLAPGAGGRVQDWLGARGLAFNRSPKSYRNDVFEIYGYPGKPDPDYTGAQRLILCLSSFQGFERFTGAPVAAPCHQQEGSSGGGWVRNGQVQSVVSHGGCDIPSTACTLISGTYFGDAAFNLYEKSSGGISKGKRKRLRRCRRFKRAKKARCRGRVQRFAADPR
jgi:hypothetical protein